MAGIEKEEENAEEWKAAFAIASKSLKSQKEKEVLKNNKSKSLWQTLRKKIKKGKSGIKNRESLMQINKEIDESSISPIIKPHKFKENQQSTSKESRRKGVSERNKTERELVYKTLLNIAMISNAEEMNM